MTRDKEEARRIAELNAAFLRLNEKGKDSALTILRALNFAQAVMETQTRTGQEAAQSRPDSGE